MPSTRIWPASLGMAPEMISSWSVLLPAPFSPMRPCTVPGATAKSTPFRAFTPLNDFEMLVQEMIAFMCPTAERLAPFAVGFLSRGLLLHLGVVVELLRVLGRCH